MGFSVAIIAFALDDAPRVQERMGWRITDVEVGQPVDLATTPVEQLLSPEFQAANNPHFSAASGLQHFFVYVSLKELGPWTEPDYAQLSRIAPLTVHVVVETSLASSIEYWSSGERIWALGGASGQGYEVDGQAPVDLEALAEEYRDWWAGLDHDEADLEPEEIDLPQDNADLIHSHFSSLTGNYFAGLTGFRYDGDHPPLYRLSGDLPTVSTR